MKLIYFCRTLHVPNAILGNCIAPVTKWSNLIRRKIIRCALIFIFCPVGIYFSFGIAVAQSGDDPFIDSIDRMKQSVGAIICIQGDGRIQINGTGFFIDGVGSFLTAYHVVREFMPAGVLHDLCAQSNIYFSVEKWTRQAQNVIGFRFFPEQCVADALVDVARCRTVEDMSKHPGLRWRPMGVQFDNTDQPDGTAVAFTGFPLSTVIPLTARAHIAAYPIPPKPGETHFEMDNTAWGGASGGPVYLGNGHVVGLMVQRGEGASSGLSVAVDSRAISRFMHSHPGNQQPESGPTNAPR